MRAGITLPPATAMCLSMRDELKFVKELSMTRDLLPGARAGMHASASFVLLSWDSSDVRACCEYFLFSCFINLCVIKWLRVRQNISMLLPNHWQIFDEVWFVTHPPTHVAAGGEQPAPCLCGQRTDSVVFSSWQGWWSSEEDPLSSFEYY